MGYPKVAVDPSVSMFIFLYERFSCTLNHINFKMGYPKVAGQQREMKNVNSL